MGKCKRKNKKKYVKREEDEDGYIVVNKYEMSSKMRCDKVFSSRSICIDRKITLFTVYTFG